MMFVTDTHPFVHHVTGRRSRIGRKALRVFDAVKRGREIMIVPFTVLEEVMLLSEIGKIRLPPLNRAIDLARAVEWGRALPERQHCAAAVEHHASF